MSLSYIGSLSIGAAIPTAVAAAAAGTVGISTALPDIQARIAALQSFQPSPINFGAMLANAQATIGSINASIALGIQPPSIDQQIAEVLALLSQLLAQMTLIDVQLGIIAAFQEQLGAAGIAAYAYAGPVSALGTEVYGALIDGLPTGGNAGTQCHALVLATTDGGTWNAMSQIFKVAP